MSRTTILAVAISLLLAPLAAPVAHAKKKEKRTDQVWVHPGYASFNVGRIALLPVVSYDNNFKTENLIEGRIGQAFNGAGYRWLSATSVRSMLLSAGGDSSIKALRQALLQEPRIDSLRVVALCAQLHCDAVLGVRADLWEQLEIPYDQSGKASTTIHLTAALVGSSGTLLWNALGSQTGEGPYQNANATPMGAKYSSPDLKPVTGQGGPPQFEEVLTLLFRRWVVQFPAMAAAASPGTTAAAPPAAADTLKNAPAPEPK